MRFPVTDIVCSSVNIGSTRAGINMDAVLQAWRKSYVQCAEITADRDCDRLRQARRVLQRR